MLLKIPVCTDNLNPNCWFPSVLLTLLRFSYAQRQSASKAPIPSNYSKHSLQDRSHVTEKCLQSLAAPANDKACWIIYTDYFAHQTQATTEGVGLFCGLDDGQECIPDIRPHNSIKHTTVKAVLSLAAAKKPMI